MKELIESYRNVDLNDHRALVKNSHSVLDELGRLADRGKFKEVCSTLDALYEDRHRNGLIFQEVDIEQLAGSPVRLKFFKPGSVLGICGLSKLVIKATTDACDSGIQSYCDIGTGIGVGGVVAAKKSGVEVFGVDLNKAAVKTTIFNALWNGVDMSKFHIFHADLVDLPKILKDKKVDCIVTNPAIDVYEEKSVGERKAILKSLLADQASINEAVMIAGLSVDGEGRSMVDAVLAVAHAVLSKNGKVLLATGDVMGPIMPRLEEIVARNEMRIHSVKNLTVGFDDFWTMGEEDYHKRAVFDLTFVRNVVRNGVALLDKNGEEKEASSLDSMTDARDCYCKGYIIEISE